MDEMWVCSFCGAENDNSSNKCSVCFKTQPSKIKICSSCSTENHPSNDYCRKCGAKLSEVDIISIKQKVVEQELKKQHNMRVYWTGVTIAFFFVISSACLGISQGWVKTPSYPNIGDGWEWLGAIISIMIRIVPIVVIQMIIYPVFNYLSRRDIKISGLTMWLFLALELLVGISPFMLFGHYEWW